MMQYINPNLLPITYIFLGIASQITTAGSLPDILWQIPIGGILVYVLVRFLSYLEKRDKQEDDTLQRVSNMFADSVKGVNDNFSNTILKMHTETLTFITNESNVNREFLRTQREHMNEALARLAEEIKRNGANCQVRDAEFTALIDKILEELRKDGKNV